MKRLPIVLSLLALVALAASIAYWVLQLYQPPQRPIAAPPQAALPEPSIDAAATLFGGQAAVTATNYTLTGVVADGGESVAIIVAEGSPPKALKVGRELVPGVTLAEVHKRYVMLSDGGVMKRIDLPADTRSSGGANLAPGPGGGSMPPGGEPPVSAGPVQTQEAPPVETPAPAPIQAVPASPPGGAGATQAVPPPPPPAPMPPQTRSAGSPVRPAPTVQ